MINDIKSYLYVFAKELGHNLSEDDFTLNEIAKQIEIRALSNSIFCQNMHSACKKCRMKYEEYGSITNKKYKFCIFSGDNSQYVPNNCPKKYKKQEVFDRTEDNTVEEIRKRGRL